MKTLKSTLTGAWYPGTEREIRAMAASWEKTSTHDEAAAPARTNVRVWIENRLVAPEAEAVETPLGTIPVDRDWLDRLSLLAPVIRNDRVHAGEHSAQIEFPLLQLALGKAFSVAPLIVGSFNPDQRGMCVRALASLMDAETLLVISSDFTHYGSDFSYAPYGTKGGTDVRRRVAEVDGEACAKIAAGDADGFCAVVERTGATICGRVPIELALRAFPAGSALVRLRYATSSDVEGDFSRFVCYAAMVGRVEWPKAPVGALGADDRAFLLKIAREAMEHAVRTGRPLPANHFVGSAPAATKARMGAFVTLNDRTTGALRGCIGEILPVRPLVEAGTARPLVEAVTARAADSALHDPRFSPVTPSELAGLRVEVSALMPPKPVASWREIVLGRDGMTLEKNGRFAVFLPQVAPEQGWDLATTLSYLSQKAGLPPEAWREGAEFETFQADVFHE